MKKNNKFTNTYNVIGQNVKKIRKENKITQEELCARLQILDFQISRSDISKLENGQRLITDFEIIGLSQSLKVSILDLFKDFI